MDSAISRVLVLYSSPGDQPRVRIDKEHRALDEVLKRRGLDLDLIRRLHATTLADFVQALREDPYEIVQFSGHGDPAGIYLEDQSSEKGTTVDAQTVAALLQDALPKLRVAIFASCYSADSIPTLLSAAPFLITMQASASDEAAIEFVSTFYDEYFRYNAVEPAFQRAVIQVEIAKMAGEIKPVLSRRGEKKNDYVTQACFGRKADSIFIDTKKAQPALEELGVPVDDFLALLTRKIRLHRWVFRYPRSQAPLPIGPFVGLFSWTDAEDVVVCERVTRLRADLDAEGCEAFVRLMVAYNDLCSEQYRVVPGPSDPQNAKLLKKALGHATDQAATYFKNGEYRASLEKLDPAQFKISRANVLANLSQADARYSGGDFERTVMYLELALTAFHDLVDHLMNQLTE